MERFGLLIAPLIAWGIVLLAAFVAGPELVALLHHIPTLP